jgi:hypothetical protein
LTFNGLHGVILQKISLLGGKFSFLRSIAFNSECYKKTEVKNTLLKIIKFNTSHIILCVFTNMIRIID